MALLVTQHGNEIKYANSLQEELDMYKSVQIPFEFKSKTSKTRVTRLPLLEVNQSREIEERKSSTYGRVGDNMDTQELEI
jgi:hypothetical protein